MQTRKAVKSHAEAQPSPRPSWPPGSAVAWFSTGGTAGTGEAPPAPGRHRRHRILAKGLCLPASKASPRHRAAAGRAPEAHKETQKETHYCDQARKWSRICYLKGIRGVRPATGGKRSPWSDHVRHHKAAKPKLFVKEQPPSTLASLGTSSREPAGRHSSALRRLVPRGTRGNQCNYVVLVSICCIPCMCF